MTGNQYPTDHELSVQRLTKISVAEQRRQIAFFGVCYDVWGNCTFDRRGSNRPNDLLCLAS